MTRHAPPDLHNFTYPRRLLKVSEVCAKLSMTRSTFFRKKSALEASGFPAPALEADQFGSTRWDEKAIDLWLDTRMPATLLHTGRNQTLKIADPESVRMQLRERAGAIVAGLSS